MQVPAKVLIVDDDAAIRQILNFTLRRAGYEVVQMHDGREVLTAALEHEPGLILLDLHMPHTSGLSALQQLRQEPRTRHIPVVALSGADNDRKAAWQAGATAFVCKPYGRASLLEIIRQTLESQAEIATGH